MMRYFNPLNKSREQLRKEELAHIRREKWREFWTPEHRRIIAYCAITLLVSALVLFVYPQIQFTLDQ